jgi:hypothetical protein
MRVRIPARIIAAVARLGRIAAASAGPQEGYRCHAYQNLDKFHRNFTSSFYGCRGWPTSEFSHVASNVRVAGDKENTFGQRFLNDMQIARFVPSKVNEKMRRAAPIPSYVRKEARVSDFNRFRSNFGDSNFTVSAPPVSSQTANEPGAGNRDRKELETRVRGVIG